MLPKIACPMALLKIIPKVPGIRLQHLIISTGLVSFLHKACIMVQTLKWAISYMKEMEPFHLSAHLQKLLIVTVLLPIVITQLKKHTSVAS